MNDSPLIISARTFAVRQHDGLFRPNEAREPYHVHLREVAELVERSGGSAEEIAAGWLHDVVEDTDATLGDIEARFGPEVAAIVDGLTDPPGYEGMPTLERKTLQAKRVRAKSESIRRCKLADQTSNVRSVAIDPPVKWDKQKCLDYIEGARRIAEACQGVSVFLDAEFSKAHVDAVAARS